MSAVDIFDDIRRHAGAAGGKFMHENVVLAAVEEILTQQSLDRSAVSYMGALMLSLQSDAGAEPAVYAGVLKLLERALAHVPRGLLLAKAGRIAAVETRRKPGDLQPQPGSPVQGVAVAA